jgi:hypothetical protein
VTMPATRKRPQSRPSSTGTTTAPAAPVSSSTGQARAPIQGTPGTPKTSKRSRVASTPSTATARIVSRAVSRQRHRCADDQRVPVPRTIVAIVTAVHISQRRTTPVPVSAIASRKIRLASTRSMRAPSAERYDGAPPGEDTSPSCSSAAGRCRPVRGTNHPKSAGTDVRSVVNDSGSAGTSRSPTCRSR